jgi:tight adherence protein C
MQLPDQATVGILAFFGAASLSLVALQGYFLERRQVSHSLRRVRSMDAAPTDLRRRQLAEPLRRRLITPGLRRLGGLARRMTPASAMERLTRQLVYAGSPPGWDAERMLAFKVLGAVVFTVGGVIFATLSRSGVLRVASLAVLLCAVGYYLPEVVLRSRARQRQELLQRALPDSLDLLSITVQAGLGFDAAVSRVARRVTGPLGEELYRVIQEMQLGRSRVDALRDLAARSTVPELKSFVLAMVQAEAFGISIGKVLQIQAREMRTKRRQRAEEKAQKVPVKIVFPLILCIFPALFVVLMGPAAIRIYESLIRG